MHRRIVHSDIYAMPPLYLRVFERLILEANYYDDTIPYKHPGDKVVTTKLIQRGERLTSIRQICQWVGWYEYGVFRTPSPKTVKGILDWLVGSNMIEIHPRESNREGTHYKIVNYSHYQDKDEAKGNNAETVTASKQEYSKNNKEYKEYKDPLTQDEERFLNILAQVEGYPFDRKKDLEMYHTLTDRYPNLDLCDALETWRIYKLDKPLKKNANPRSQINTSFRKYTEWGRHIKQKEVESCDSLASKVAHY